MINLWKESYLQARDLWNLLVICVPSFVNSIKIWCLCGIIHWPGSWRAIKICFSDKFVQACDTFISSRHATTPWRRLFWIFPEHQRKGGSKYEPQPIFAHSFQQFPGNYCLKECSSKFPGFLQTFEAKWQAICLPNALPWDLTMRPKWCIVLHWTTRSREPTLHYAKSKASLFTWTLLGVSAPGALCDWLQGCQCPTVWDFKARKWLKWVPSLAGRDANAV